MASFKTQICQKLATIMSATTLIKYVGYDHIKLIASDFKEHELPATQIIDMGETSAAERTRARKSWNLSIEVVIGPKETYTVSQVELWDLMETLEQAIFVDPKLGIPSIITMELMGSDTDIHILQPYYCGRIDLRIDYYQPLVRTC